MARNRAGHAAWWVSALAAALLCAACTSSDVDETERDSSGNVLEGGDVGVQQLQVGDCITKGALEGTEAAASASPAVNEIESLPAVPCTEPHGGEVVLVDGNFFGEATERPTDNQLFDQATEPCMSGITDYTGFDLDAYLSDEGSSAPDELFAPYTLVPNPQSWEGGDRSMICIAVSVEPDLETIVERTGSAQA